MLPNIMLVGVPGSGKSQVATHLRDKFGYKIVSSSEIREELYGVGIYEGGWDRIEAEIRDRFEKYFTEGHPICYQATNYRSDYRKRILEMSRAIAPKQEWMAFQMDCTLEQAIRRSNFDDDRIRYMQGTLMSNPPRPAEGFFSVICGDEQYLTRFISIVQSTR